MRTCALIVGCLVVVGCGESTVVLTDDPRLQQLDIERRSSQVIRDAGQPATVPEVIVELDAGTPEEPPRDAGQAEQPRDAGRPEQPRDAGVPTECTPTQTRSCTTICGSGSSQTCTTDGHWGSCAPPRESCTNGRDDDCDGFSDARDPDCPPVVHTCESQDGNGCNGDLGYGDHCAAADNTNGCSPQRFWAWCNRRNPALGEIWDNYVRGWVDDRCDGVVRETGTQYSTWFCTSSTNDRYECTTPLVLSFDGAPVQFERSNAAFSFSPGEPKASDWPLAVTPWLARDLDRDGQIDDGRELFGSDTRVGPRTAKNGFEALDALDENGDRVVDERDPAFDELLVWRDVDGDKRSSAKELVTLRDLGVTSLETSFALAVRCDGRGNCERERGAFTMRYGTRGAVVDVYLRTWVPSPLTFVCAMP